MPHMQAASRSCSTSELGHVPSRQCIARHRPCPVDACWRIHYTIHNVGIADVDLVDVDVRWENRSGQGLCNLLGFPPCVERCSHELQIPIETEILITNEVRVRHTNAELV